MISIEQTTRWSLPDTTPVDFLSKSGVLLSVNTPPKVGEFWAEQGGVYASIMRGRDDTPDYHLIIPTDPAAEIAEIAWGSRGTEEKGAIDALDGLANTRALIAGGNDHPAAKWVRGLVINGHTDFYLPSRRELSLAWANTPELFSEAWYWSSTQYSPTNAWIQVFGNGSQSILGKGIAYRARAVRRLIIQ